MHEAEGGCDFVGQTPELDRHRLQYEELVIVLQARDAQHQRFIKKSRYLHQLRPACSGVKSAAVAGPARQSFTKPKTGPVDIT